MLLGQHHSREGGLESGTQRGDCLAQRGGALGPVYCQRLADGNTLVSIRSLSKIIELEAAGQVVWEGGRELVYNQYAAVRLGDGHTLIADAGHFRVIEIDAAKQIVWEQGGFGYPAKAYRY